MTTPMTPGTATPMPVLESHSTVGFSCNAKGLLQPEVKLRFATAEEAQERGPEMLKAIYEALMQSGLPIARPQ